LRLLLRSAKGRVFRAAAQKKTTKDLGRAAPVLRVFLKKVTESDSSGQRPAEQSVFD
jgi:hypothetical protein